MSLTIHSVTVRGWDELKPFDVQRADLAFSMVWGILLASMGGYFRLVHVSMGARGTDAVAYACMVFAPDHEPLPLGDGLVIRVRKMGAGERAESIEVEIDPRRFPQVDPWEGTQLFSYENPTPTNRILSIKSLGELETVIDHFRRGVFHYQ